MATARPDADLIQLNPGTVDQLLPDLPKIMRIGLEYVSLIRKGTLEITLPDGRRVRTGGQEDGPAAKMIVKDYN